MTLEEIKSRINPADAVCLGTESHERKWLCDRIEELEKQRGELLGALELMKRDKWHWEEIRDKAIARVKGESK